MMFKQKMEAMQTRRCEECIPDRSSETSETRPQEDLKTMLDIANCRAQGARLMTEKLDEFLLSKEKSAETEDKIAQDLFRNALQEQIDIMFDICERLQDICQRLGV